MYNNSLLPNGWRYWRWGGRGLCLGAEKLEARNMLAVGAARAKRSPRRPVHALLGVFYANQKPLLCIVSLSNY